MAKKGSERKKDKSEEIFDIIDGLIEKSRREIQQTSRRQKIEIYGEGLKGKLRQARFAIERMTSLSPDVDSSSGVEVFSCLDKAQFFCDAFWAFSYASLDIVAQIINQFETLRLDERKISFKTICSKSDLKSAIRHEIEKIQRMDFFKNLEKYRNCCLHRRLIYIKEETTKHTPGYSISSSGPTSRLTLCDDPYALTPRIDQDREIVEYCSKSFQHLCKSLKQLFALL